MSRPVHTQFAMKAIDLAELFKALVGNTKVVASEGAQFSVELSAPEGLSTGGGAQSVQHIKLTRTGLVVVAGSSDQVERSAELRSYDYLAAAHGQRYKGAPLPIDRASYEVFLKRARDFFKQQDMAIVVKEGAPVAVARPPAAGSSLGMSIGAIAVVVGVAVAAYILMGR